MAFFDRSVGRSSLRLSSHLFPSSFHHPPPTPPERASTAHSTHEAHTGTHAHRITYYFSTQQQSTNQPYTMTRLPCSSSLPFCICIISLHVLSVCQAFLTIPTATSHARLVLSSSIRRSASTVVVCSTVTPSSAETNTSSPSSNPPTWESKQHLYGVDMILSNEMDASSNSMSVTLDADGAEVTAASGDYLPLPQTYITCGKCNSLFAIAEEDLGKGKGWYVYYSN